MFFSVTALPTRHPAYAATGRALERFLEETQAKSKGCAYEQDDTRFMLTLDMPGIAKDQLSVAIDGTVVRVQSKEGASRTYRTAYEFPQEIDAGLSTAHLENGVLTLKLTKKVPVEHATELTVQ
jgi:HSP20 family protein